MSILQNVGTYMGVLMRIPIWCLISTLIGTRKLRSLVISMLMSILQDVGTYMGVLMTSHKENALENHAVWS
jgi:hypothetical protein